MATPSRRNRFAVACASVLFVIALGAIILPLFTPRAARRPFYAEPKIPPCWAHPFGTDENGRDVFHLVIFGGRVSLFIGVAVTAACVAVGLGVGLVGGYSGGLADAVGRFLTDVTLAFPGLLLAIGIAVVFQPGLWTVCLSLSLVGWAGFARLVRSVVLTLREREFVAAAVAIGSPVRRVLLCHILPNALPMVIVAASLRIGGFILAESALSFLGLGVNFHRTPTWGAMVYHGSDLLVTQPWISLFPGLAIAVTVIAFNVIGDAVRDRLDPRARG